MLLVRCVACDGYGWVSDAFDDEDGSGETECSWCKGVGYVYRDDQGVDHPVPPADYGRVAAELETLETARLRELGYTGAAKKPWEQEVRGENAKRLKRDS